MEIRIGGKRWMSRGLNSIVKLCLFQVMETENIIYLVTEYASRGEIFGKAYQMKECK